MSNHGSLQVALELIGLHLLSLPNFPTLHRSGEISLGHTNSGFNDMLKMQIVAWYPYPTRLQ